MPKQLTVKMLHDYMISVGEDIFEDIECDNAFENRYTDFGNFLLTKYPDDEELNEIIDNEDDWGWWDFVEIEFLQEEDPSTGIDLIYSEFVEFCNNELALVKAVLDIIGDKNEND